MSVFSANAQGPFQPREEPVIALDSTIDPELRKESVRAVAQDAAEAQFVRQALGSAMLDGTAEGKPLYPGAAGILPGGKAQPADNFGLIRSSRCQESLSIEKASPVLRATVTQITVHIESGGAETSPGIRVEHLNDGAIIKLDRGVPSSDFHRKRHLVLASHDLEGAPRLEIHVSVPDGKGGGRLEQERIVEFLPVVALHAEAGTCDSKGVRRRTVALVESVLRIQVPDGHEREVAIGTPQEKVLAVPSCRR